MPTPRPLAAIRLIPRGKTGGTDDVEESPAHRAARPAPAMPAARARSDTASTSMPVPSSLISSTTDSPAVAALRRIAPSGRLPAAIRCSGVSMAWLIALRTRWMHGVHHAFDQKLVDLRALTHEIEPHAFTAVARQIANDEWHPAEDLSNRHQADAHHGFAKIAQLPLDSRAVLLQRPPPLLERNIDALERILQAGARDDHVADEAHEIVEPGQVHTNEIGRRRSCDLAWTLDDGRLECGVTKTGRCRRLRRKRFDPEGLVLEPVVAPGRQLPLVVRLHLEFE